MSKELLNFMSWVNQDEKLGYTSIGIERIVNRYITSKDLIIDEAYKNYRSKSKDLDLPENLYNKLIDDLNKDAMFPIDNPNRMFKGINKEWKSANNNATNVKELIPEFFMSDPSFLLNK